MYTETCVARTALVRLSPRNPSRMHRHGPHGYTVYEATHYNVIPSVAVGLRHKTKSVVGPRRRAPGFRESCAPPRHPFSNAAASHKLEQCRESPETERSTRTYIARTIAGSLTSDRTHLFFDTVGNHWKSSRRTRTRRTRRERVDIRLHTRVQPEERIAALETREAAEIAEACSPVVEEKLKSSEQPRHRQPAQSTTYASTPSRNIQDIIQRERIGPQYRRRWQDIVQALYKRQHHHLLRSV